MWFCAFYVAISLISCFHQVNGRHSSPIEESMDHKSLNIPHMNTIKTEYGDIYDCVELYKQPAFQHPLLKDHKIQIRANKSQQKKVFDEGSASNLTYGLKEECPLGTVPIRRTTKKEQLQAKAIFTQQFLESNNPNGQQDRFAGVFIDSGSLPKFSQAGAYISTHNPHVEQGQLSASVISLESAPGSGLFDTIRVGWMVYPDLYSGDTRTRLFTAWGTMGSGNQQGCFNTYCPGFVQVNNRIPIDMVIDLISDVPHGNYQYMKIGVYKDEISGNWGLTYGENDEVVGYWPRDLFTGLKDNGAGFIRWGGWVSSITQNLPMMGDGLLEKPGSLMRKITYHFVTHQIPNKLHAQYHIMQSECFKAGLNPFNEHKHYWDDNLWYGGDGGFLQNCP